VAFNLENQARETWIEQLGASFYVHRSLSIVLVLVNLLLYRKVNQLGHKNLVLVAKGVLVIIGMEILLGVVLAYFALPALAQPLHLLLGTALFGFQFLLMVIYHYAQTIKKLTPEMVA
jgi:heme a synthase